MNGTTSLVLILCAGALLWNYWSGIRIVQELDKNNMAATVFVMRYTPWRFLEQYKKLTVSRSGETGPLYYHYAVSILAVLGLGLSAMFLLMQQG